MKAKTLGDGEWGVPTGRRFVALLELGLASGSAKSDQGAHGNFREWL